MYVLSDVSSICIKLITRKLVNLFYSLFCQVKEESGKLGKVSSIMEFLQI